MQSKTARQHGMPVEVKFGTIAPDLLLELMWQPVRNRAAQKLGSSRAEGSTFDAEVQRPPDE